MTSWKEKEAPITIWHLVAVVAIGVVGGLVSLLIESRFGGWAGGGSMLLLFVLVMAWYAWKVARAD